MQQRSPEWHAARAGRLTASEAGALLGLSPHTSEAEAFRRLVRKMHGMPSEFVGNVATEYGTFHEPGALAEYKMETGNAVDEVAFVEFQDWLGASPDGLILDDGGLEIKCPFGQRKNAPPTFKTLEEQQHYYAQVQINLFCTQRGWWHFYQWSPAGTRLETIKYDGEWLGANLPILKGIWDKAKAADPKDYEGPVRCEYDTPEAGKLVAEYDELSEAIENAQARKKDIIARMVDIAGKKNAVIGGRNLTLVKRAGSVAYAKAIKELLGDPDLEKWRGKASETWMLK